jgi:hypothetical protein
VDEQRLPIVELEQEILATPTYSGEGTPAQEPFEIGVQRPAQASFVDLDSENRASDHVGKKRTADRFNLG